jgi:glycosyltransferase involved in cell wall biosynthesis
MKIVHLLDDPALGGINRLLAAQLPELSAWQHEKIVVPSKYRIAPRLDADVVVVHLTAAWSKLPFLASLRVRFAGKPIILVEHTYTASYELYCAPKPDRFQRMLRLAYGFCDGIVAVSQAQGRWLIESGLAPETKIAIVPQALDFPAMRALPLPVPHDGPLRLVAYGRYAPQKGFETLIAAMKQIPPCLARLTLAGYGPLESTLRDLATGAPNIEIRGPVAEPDTLLAEADAVVIPSRWEAYGLVAAEARMAGRPVIASRVDGLIEQIDRRIGVLVPPDDVNRLATAIARLSGADLTLMGAMARQSVSNDWQRHLTAWRRLYIRLAQPDASFQSVWRSWLTDIRRARLGDAVELAL